MLSMDVGRVLHTLCMVRTGYIKEWEAHCGTVCSGQSQAVGAQTTQKKRNPCPNGPISEHEVIESLHKLKSGKAAGLDHGRIFSATVSNLC